MRRDDEPNHVAPQNGDGLGLGAGEHVAPHDGEVGLAGHECFLTRFPIRRWHDLQAYAGMGVGDGTHEGGKELLAVTAHRTSGHTQGYMGKEEPSNDGPDCDASEQTCEDHQKYSSSVLAHDAFPFVSLNRKPNTLGDF